MLFYLFNIKDNFINEIKQKFQAQIMYIVKMPSYMFL